MSRRSLVLLITVAAMALSSGCAGLMMNVKDVDAQHANVGLKSGDSLAIDDTVLESSISKANPKADAKQLASQLKQELTTKFSEKGITVTPEADHKLSVEVTRYERGCGGCRGFFPVFGLGNTYLDGQVTLSTPEGQRVILVEKTGQSSGISKMGDQTETNVGYFATSVASKLALAD